MIFLAFVVPPAVYCLFLSAINRRRHPVIVAGPWDFVGVLFAASGFLLLGGPAILMGLYDHWHLSWLLGQTRYLQGIGEHWSFWISLWICYFVAVAGGSGLLLWRRKAFTSIYNVDSEVFADVLTSILDRLHLEWFRNGPRRLLIRLREAPAETSSPLSNASPVPHSSPLSAMPIVADNARPLVTTARAGSQSGSPWSELALESFSILRHVTLHWLACDEAVRAEVETELATALSQIPTRHNPAAAWFLSLALGLFFSAFLALLALLTMRILQLSG